jgi:hypothetical protein
MVKRAQNCEVQQMVRLVTLVLLLSPIVLAQDQGAFESVAKLEIRAFVSTELMGHYTVQDVTMLGTNDHTAEWGGFSNGYGLKTVTARFVAVRNDHWNKGLNRKIAENCDQAGNLYVLCQPTGHEFSGKIEVDMAFTEDGWKVLSRNHRNLREFALSNYLLLDGKPKEGYVLPPKGGPH